MFLMNSETKCTKIQSLCLVSTFEKFSYMSRKIYGMVKIHHRNLKEETFNRRQLAGSKYRSDIHQLQGIMPV